MSKRDQNTLPLNYDAVPHNGQSSFPFTDEPSILEFLLAMWILI